MSPRVYPSCEITNTSLPWSAHAMASCIPDAVSDLPASSRAQASRTARRGLIHGTTADAEAPPARHVGIDDAHRQRPAGAAAEPEHGVSLGAVRDIAELDVDLVAGDHVVVADHLVQLQARLKRQRDVRRRAPRFARSRPPPAGRCSPCRPGCRRSSSCRRTRRRSPASEARRAPCRSRWS